jgi:hypothetical protein
VKTELGWGTITRNLEPDSLHDIIDILSEDIERLRIDIGVSDKRAKVDWDSQHRLLPHLGRARDLPNNLRRCSAP